MFPDCVLPWLQDGDPYRDEMEQCVELIMDRLQSRGFGNHYSLAYQSRVGPVRALSNTLRPVHPPTAPFFPWLAGCAWGSHFRARESLYGLAVPLMWMS